MSLLLLFNFPLAAPVFVTPTQILALDTTYGSETVMRSLLDTHAWPTGRANFPTALFVACGTVLQGDGQLILIRPDGSSVAVAVTHIGEVDMPLPPGNFEAHTYGVGVVAPGVLDQIGTWQCYAKFGLFLTLPTRFEIN